MYKIAIAPSHITGNFRTIRFHIYNASSKQAALRECFRHFIRSNQMKRQPQTDLYSHSTFKGVSIEHNPLQPIT